MDLGAAFRKFILGDQSADVIPGVNVRETLTNPNGYINGQDPVMYAASQEIIKEGQAKIDAQKQLDQQNYTLGTYRPAYDPVAAKVAADNAKKTRLKGEGNTLLDQLLGEYNSIIEMIRNAGRDQTQRINKNYDDKITGQTEDMNVGMYDTDAAAAANNLADSSFRSFDRGKVRKAAEQNIASLNEGRGKDLGEVGKMVESDVAKYEADKAGIDRTRGLLGESDNLDEVQSTVNNLDATKRGMGANKAKYGAQGDFVAAASKLGNYDTSGLEAALQRVVDNASATPESKAGTINDLLNGTTLDDDKKNGLKNKYTQMIG